MAVGSYTGIGSRSMPSDVLFVMERIVEQLALEGWLLRSGHAKGADQAFERGAKGRAEVFLPWASYELGIPIRGEAFDSPLPDAYEIAEVVHPAWDRCSKAGMRLHARNSHQILGPDLDDPVDFVVCWSSERREPSKPFGWRRKTTSRSRIFAKKKTGI